MTERGRVLPKVAEGAAQTVKAGHNQGVAFTQDRQHHNNVMGLPTVFQLWPDAIRRSIISPSMRSTERRPSPHRRGLIIVTTLATAYVASHFFRASNVTTLLTFANYEVLELLATRLLIAKQRDSTERTSSSDHPRLSARPPKR